MEICVDSIESALAAVEGGCSRIELCSALSEGGLTPSPGMLKFLKEQTFSIPIFCMLRPRGGSDFVYTDHEIKSIIYDIKMLSACGADGFVFGALNENKEIDVDNCKRIVKECGENHPVTFHRAFDFTDPTKMIANLDLIKSIGFKRVLTSGFKESAEIGLENLIKMAKWAVDSDLIILPGAGINEYNLQMIKNETGLKEFHASAKKKKYNKSATISLSGSMSAEEEIIYVTDVNIVKKLVEICNKN